MSRRRTKDVHHAFGGVRFKCPSGHVLGRAIKQMDSYSLEAGLVRVDSPDGQTKIKARCQACAEEGRHSDLQASWDDKVRPMLDRLDTDPSAGLIDVVIGG